MTAQQTLLAKYGAPGLDYQQHFCKIWEIQHDFPWFPAEKVLINKDFADKLFQAFTAIQNQGLQGQIKTFGGCYEYRQSRTTSLLSLHAWACAMDLNQNTEVLHQTTTNWTPEFIKCMTDAGLFWGGNFHGTKDPMHFALLDG